MAAPANSVESEMATEDYCEQCRVFPDIRPFPPSPPRLLFPRSPPRLPFSPSLPQNQEHDNILVHPDASTVTPPYVAGLDPAVVTMLQKNDDILVHPDASTVTPPYVAGGSDPFEDFLDFSLFPPFLPLLPSPPWLPFSPSLPQNQEHDDILVHPDASTVTPPYVAGSFLTYLQNKYPVQNQEHDDMSRKNNGGTSSGVGSDDKFNQRVDESVDGRTIGTVTPPYVAGSFLTYLQNKYRVQNQEHDDMSRKNNGRTSSGVGSDDKFNQGVDESVDGRTIGTVTPPYVAGSFLTYLQNKYPVQNQEHDDMSRKNNGRTSSGVGSDNKFNQGVDESVDGRTIGKLFVSNREIAKGSNGTIVLEGTHEVRQVAVKRLVKAAYHDIAYKEYKNLCASDRHSNIVRLYGVEEDKDFVYLALERCTGSLNDLIQMQFLDAPTTNGDQATEFNIQYKVHLQSMKGTLPEVKLWEDNGYPSPTLWKLMRDMVSGLVHLHELGMVHRDLKPQNVLIVKEGSVCAKLSDMGISKCLAGDKSSLGNHATGCGTSGWQAPELLLHGRQTRAIDVFSLGCVLFYCITGGKHPFGDPLVRDVNIVKGKVKLFLVKHIPEAMDLLDHLLDPKAELRPKASEVLIHPMFWDSDKRLSFLRDASDRVQQEDFGSDILKELGRIAPRVLGTKRGKNINMVLLNWDEKIDPSLLNDIDNPRRYYYDRVCDLLRFIRNKMNHFFDLPREIQDTLGPVPEGFDGYFRSRFPKLLMEAYKVLHKYCTEEEWFKRYFKGSAV